MVTIEKIVTVCTVTIKKVVYIIVTHNVTAIYDRKQQYFSRWWFLSSPLSFGCQPITTVINTVSVFITVIVIVVLSLTSLLSLLLLLPLSLSLFLWLVFWLDIQHAVVTDLSCVTISELHQSRFCKKTSNWKENIITSGALST